MKEYMLSVRRVLNAPVQKVFEAWTNSEQAKQWLSPESHTVPDAVIEPKAGGTYKIVMRDEKGGLPTTNGVVKEIVPNKKLVFTWKWEGGEMDSNADGETLVTVEFKPVGEKQTELILTHEMFKSEQSKERHTQGWESVYNRLEKFISK